MKGSKLLVLGFVILFIVCSCSTSTDSNDTLDFEDINIEYYKVGGWINSFSLTIDSSGLVQAYVRSHSNLELMDSNGISLSKKEMQTLSELFSSFENFDNYYEPEHYYTDGNIHRIILHENLSSDTCSVYDPQNCILPDDLKQIIDFMEQKIDELLN